MPGEFLQEVRIFRCGTRPDGSAIMCSEIGWFKVPFGEFLSRDDPGPGWQAPDGGDIHIPLDGLVAEMRKFGIELTYDDDDLARRLGPPPSESVEPAAGAPSASE